MAEKMELDSREWDKFLDSAQAKAKDFSKYLLAGVNIFGFQDVMSHFDREEGPNGAWQSRKEVTNRAYDLLGGSYSSSNKILQLTGKLRGSLLPSAGGVRRKDRLSVEMFTNVAYAHRHDMGTGGMPQREFLWLSDKAKDLILTMMIDQLAES